jgi:translation initiation factor IF-3
MSERKPVLNAEKYRRLTYREKKKDCSEHKMQGMINVKDKTCLTLYYS